MGDNFLLQQIRNFKKGRDRAQVETNTPRLFQRPDLLDTLYPGRPLEGVAFSEGEELFAVASRDGRHVDLVRGHVTVGRTDADAATDLLAALREPGGGGVVRVRVEEVSTVSKVAQVRIVKDE